MMWTLTQEVTEGHLRRREPLLGAKIAGGPEVTPWAGVSLLVEVQRKCRVMQTASRVPSSKKVAKGPGQGQMAEFFDLPSALGGGRIGDMQWPDRVHDEGQRVGRPPKGRFHKQ